MSFERNCNRKTFLKEVATGLGKITLGSFVISTIPSCDNEEENPDLMVFLNKIENNGLQTIGGTLALDINKIDPEYGILLFRESETEIKAYSRRCTHADCVVQPFVNDESACFCHGSIFSISGAAISGPADASLDQYQTILDGDVLTIKANSLFQVT